MSQEPKDWSKLLHEWHRLMAANESSPENKAGLDQLRMIAVHARAEKSMHEAVQTMEKLVGYANRHKASLEAHSERIRRCEAKFADLRSGIQRLQEIDTRLGVIALNAGLEGSRTENRVGQALVRVADEVRAQVNRSEIASNELLSTIEELAQESDQLSEQINSSRITGSHLVEEASNCLAQSHQSDQSLAELGLHLLQQTGFDANLAESIENAKKYSEALAGTLASLRTKNPPRRWLLPVLEPIIRMLSELEDEGNNPDGTT
jgi:methyl-accepting chemotaxis protein